MKPTRRQQHERELEAVKTMVEEEPSTILIASTDLSRMSAQNTQVVRDSADLADTYLKDVLGIGFEEEEDNEFEFRQNFGDYGEDDNVDEL
jgi:hypothetical protein